MSTYYSFLEVQVDHNYYDGLQRVFEYQLNSESIQLLNNTEAVFRIHATGFKILATKQTIEIFHSLVKEYHNELLLEEGKVSRALEPAIVIRAYSADGKFNQVTSTNIIPNRNCYLFTNKNKSLENNVLLHTTTYATDKDIVELGGEKLTTLVERFDYFKTPIIIFHLTIEDLLKKFQTTNEKTINNKYSAAFLTKSNIWKYLIFGAQTYQQMTLSDLDNDVEFQYTGVEIVNDKESVVYLSSKPVMLRENFVQRFQLEVETNEVKKVLIKRLPVASAMQSNTMTLNGKQTVVSEIFVNL